jgi:predicted metalloprotease
MSILPRKRTIRVRNVTKVYRRFLGEVATIVAERIVELLAEDGSPLARCTGDKVRATVDAVRRKAVSGLNEDSCEVAEINAILKRARLSILNKVHANHLLRAHAAS